MNSLGESQKASISQGSLHKLLSDTEILKSIMELRVSHLNGQLFESILFLWVIDHSHEIKPGENLIRIHFIRY